MRAVDTNILVYSHRRESQHHSSASGLLTELAEGDQLWAIPWPCCYEFLSVVTNRGIWKERASTPEQAWEQFCRWKASPVNRMIGETEGFAEVLGQLVNRPDVTGGKVHDARIAAICMAHGIEVLLTADRDFSLFPKLPTVNPISAR